MKHSPAEIESFRNALPRGKANAITTDALANILGLPHGRTAEAVRDLAREAVLDHGVLVGSCPLGLYGIETAEELEETVAGLESRIAGLEGRIGALLHNWAWSARSKKHE